MRRTRENRQHGNDATDTDVSVTSIPRELCLILQADKIERRNIGSAGYAVGYQSRSQFSREYSRLYGVSPPQHMDGSSTT